jgi:aryl-alcohol dehydrogenase-like predicted oxidoreductase
MIMRYRTLGRSGLRVSEICLGTMTFGEDWGWGACEEVSRRILDRFADAGGNFIDTANSYTGGSSETFLGRFLEGRRDSFVLGTKYTHAGIWGDPNGSGNHRKNLVRSLEESLQRLRTGYVDVLWLHAWDFLTPVEEVMRALDDIVTSGKALYIGVSDTPAWVAARANTLAELRGWTRFIGLQAEYSLVQRTAERDLVPMAAGLGLGFTAWAPLAAGLLTGKYTIGPASSVARGRIDEAELYRGTLSDANLAIARAVAGVAMRRETTPARVALAWLLERRPAVIPIVGARTEEQLRDSLGALDLALQPADLEELDRVSRPDLGFPHDFLAAPTVQQLVYGGTRADILA